MRGSSPRMTQVDQIDREPLNKLDGTITTPTAGGADADGAR
jgi:hypothetical protein